MRRKIGLACLAAIVVLAVSPAPGSAQRAGFEAGIVQGHFGPPPQQNHGVEPRSTFTAVPTWNFQPVQLPFVLQPNIIVSLVPTFPTVIVPNQVLVPGQTIVPSPFVSPSPTGFVPTNPVLAPNPFIPLTGSRVLPVGMPRADVIRQFGMPSVTVITSTGETLYFTGNVTVIIQNGVVVSQR